MKRENIIHSENFALGFYGVPTHLEKYYGVKILSNLIMAYKDGKIKHTEKKRVMGYMAVGSAISNIKLETTSSQIVKDHFIKELYQNLDGVDVQAVWLDVDGHNYTSFVFENDDIKCLFP